MHTYSGDFVFCFFVARPPTRSDNNIALCISSYLPIYTVVIIAIISCERVCTWALYWCLAFALYYYRSRRNMLNFYLFQTHVEWNENKRTEVWTYWRLLRTLHYDKQSKKNVAKRGGERERMKRSCVQFRVVRSFVIDGPIHTFIWGTPKNMCYYLYFISNVIHK